MTKQPHANICGAKTRSGLPCRNRPMKNGRCRMHGGKSTGPPQGNKNAVTTGEYETIWMDALDEQERVLFYAVDTDVLKQLDEEIRLITIRERRMLQRIQSLKQQHVLEEISESSEFGTTKRYVDAVIRIQQIEEALTRVQEKKARLLELKHKVETNLGAVETSTINAQITALADLINNPAPDRVMDDG